MTFAAFWVLHPSVSPPCTPCLSVPSGLCTRLLPRSGTPPFPGARQGVLTLCSPVRTRGPQADGMCVAPGRKAVKCRCVYPSVLSLSPPQDQESSCWKAGPAVAAAWISESGCPGPWPTGFCICVREIDFCCVKFLIPQCGPVCPNTALSSAQIFTF